MLTVLPLHGFKVTHPIFESSMMVPTRLPDAFHHFMTNDNFHCQTPLRKAKFDLGLFASENASWQIWLRIEIG